MKASALALVAVVVGGLAVACSTSPDAIASSDDAVSDRDDTSPSGSFAPAKTTDKAACTPGTKEQCGDGQDNDCDGLADCADPDCSGVGQCPVCGQVDHPEASPLALPDGNDGRGVPYESTLDFKGFGSGQTLTKSSDFVKVCVTMEHSWLRDLEIKLVSPNQKEIVLSDFRGRDGDAVYLGQPNLLDDADDPVPGVGAQYCWSATATHPAMLDAADQLEEQQNGDLFDFGNPVTLPAGDYQPAGSFDDLIGSTLNGDWTIRVTDKWSQDNGFIFGWSISFNADLVQDCSVVLADPQVK